MGARRAVLLTLCAVAGVGCAALDAIEGLPAAEVADAGPPVPDGSVAALLFDDPIEMDIGCVAALDIGVFDESGDTQLAVLKPCEPTVQLVRVSGGQLVLGDTIAVGIGMEVIAAELDGVAPQELLAIGAGKLQIVRRAAGNYSVEPIMLGLNAWNLAVGDIDGDGQPDIAASNLDGSNITVLLQQPGGGFIDNGAPVAVDHPPSGIGIGDLDGDGDGDLIYSDPTGDTGGVFTLLQGAGASFAETQLFDSAAGCDAWDAVAGDVDGDARPDIMGALNCFNDGLVVARNQAAAPGTFAVEVRDVPLPGTRIAIVDGNGDQMPDLLLSGSGVQLMLGDPARPGTFVPSKGIALVVDINMAAMGDLNGDGRADIGLVVDDNQGMHKLQVYLQK